MDPNFEALLDAPLDSHEKPKPLPEGSYLGLIGQPTFDKSAKKGTPFARFPITLQQALPDVDEAALATSLGDKALTAKTKNHDLYITGDSAWRMKEFLEDHVGIEGGQPTRQAIQAAMGQVVIVVIKHEIDSQDPSKVYDKIGSTAKVPE